MAKGLENLKQIVEALIFASDTPIPTEQLKGFIEETTPGQIKKTVEALNLEYGKSNRSFQIIQVAGGYQMVTREGYSQWVKKLFQRRSKSRLTQPSLETLSVIAFQQPVSNSDLSAIRGVSCDGVLKTLLERRLITISGRGDGPGRPLLYKTTKEFLRYFGVNSITDLPKPREIEEILKEKENFPDDKKDLLETVKVDEEGNVTLENITEEGSEVQKEDAESPVKKEDVEETESIDDKNENAAQ